jgi:hypothetical protein
MAATLMAVNEQAHVDLNDADLGDEPAILGATDCPFFKSRSPDGLDLVHFVRFGDRRKAQNLPRLLREDVADGIVFVQPLHDQDDGTTALVVLTAVESVVVPLVGGLSLRVGERLLQLQWIIDQDDVGAAPSQHAAGGGGEPVALAGSDEFLHGLAVRR